MLFHSSGVNGDILTYETKELLKENEVLKASHISVYNSLDQCCIYPLTITEQTNQALIK